MTKAKTNGNGHYLRGDDAQDRNRRIYVLKHFGGLTNGVIAASMKLTTQRVQQILAKHKERSLWILDLSHAHIPGHHGEGMFTRISP